ILTAARAQPSRDWAVPTRGYLISKRARASVQRWFRAEDFDRDAATGRATLERVLQRAGSAHLPNHETLARLLHFAHPRELMAALGRGELSEDRIMTALHKYQAAEQPPPLPSLPERGRAPAAATGTGVVVAGVENLLTRLAACCHPIMGDSIVGFVTRRNGIAIHRADCPNITGMDANVRERVLEARWGTAGNQRYPVAILVQTNNTRVLVNELSSILGSEQV